MFSTILVPIDLDHKDWTQNALRHVDGINDDNVRIVLLHVMAEMPVYIAAQIPEELIKDSHDRVTKELNAFAKEAGSNVVAIIRHGKPASTILDVAEQQQADLIVIGSHEPGLAERLLGSTASRVVRSAKCSVLVSR